MVATMVCIHGISYPYYDDLGYKCTPIQLNYEEEALFDGCLMPFGALEEPSQQQIKKILEQNPHERFYAVSFIYPSAPMDDKAYDCIVTFTEIIKH